MIDGIGASLVARPPARQREPEELGLLDDARRLGATAVAIITPHFMPLTDAAVLKIYERIAALPHLVGAKISGEPVSRLDGYRTTVPAAFELRTGADSDLARVHNRGGIGVVSGVASAFPGPFRALTRALTRALRSGSEADFRGAQAQVDRVVALTRGSPALLKEALRIRGIDAGHSRTPFPRITPAVTAELRRAVEECT